MRIEADASVYASIVDGEKVMHSIEPGRHAWVQVAYGDVKLNGIALSDGDGAAVSEESKLEFEGAGEFLLFDLA